MSPELTSALIAGGVALVGGVISYFSSRAVVRHEVHQAQFKDVLAKRLELYPKLWRIHISYETNWELEHKPKTREWAEKTELQPCRGGSTRDDVSTPTRPPPENASEPPGQLRVR